MRAIGRYLFVDPCPSLVGGISSYTRLAAIELKRLGPAFSVGIFNRFPDESDDMFRVRLHEYCDEWTRSNQGVLFVESPETYAATMNLVKSGRVYIHIKLHCSKTLGRKVQGLPFDMSDWKKERAVILSADRVSAPSYAAIIATNIFYGLSVSADVIPNPFPDAMPRANSFVRRGRKTWLFVGRWDALKGVDWLDFIIRSSPGVDFLVVSDDRALKTISKYNNVRYVDGSNWDKSTLMSTVDGVLVLSIFETFSMVAAEAIAYGVPVFAWGHLGICEYDELRVVKIPPMDINAFIRALTSYDSLDFCEVGNAVFGEYASLTLNGGSTRFSVPPVGAELEVLKTIATKGGGSLMVQKSRFMKKVNKLRRDPKAFFRDARFMLGFMEKRAERMVDNPAPVELPVVPVLKSLPSSPAKEHRKFLFDIVPRKEIKIFSPPDRPVGVISCIAYEDRDVDFVRGEGGLIEKLGVFNKDFRYLVPPLLQIGKIRLDGCKSGSIVNRIDSKSRENFAKLNNLFLVNPSVDLAKEMRAISVSTRVFAILNEFNIDIPDAEDVDCLILGGEPRLFDGYDLSVYRRVIWAWRCGGVEFAMRKCVQDFSVKKPDLFLPVFSIEDEALVDSIDISTVDAGGVVGVMSRVSPACTFSEQYRSLAENISSLAVRESVYLSYRNLLDNFDDQSARELFFEYSMRDGVVFYVKD
jgi:glycosyltransferase involved in cell wall biosynthesis